MRNFISSTSLKLVHMHYVSEFKPLAFARITFFEFLSRENCDTIPFFSLSCFLYCDRGPRTPLVTCAVCRLQMESMRKKQVLSFFQWKPLSCHLSEIYWRGWMTSGLSSSTQGRSRVGTILAERVFQLVVEVKEAGRRWKTLEYACRGAQRSLAQAALRDRTARATILYKLMKWGCQDSRLKNRQLPNKDSIEVDYNLIFSCA